MKNNTKEQIKNRMIRKAAKLWDIPPNEIEMSFDPLVSLLISANAAEIEKISSDINQSQTRITEKLIQLMTPETTYGPRPAHAIIYTEPIEETGKVEPEFLFYHKKRIPKNKTSENFKNVFFSPIKPFKITSASIKYAAVGDSISEFNSKKDILNLSSNTNFNLPDSTLYLGVSSEDSSVDFNNLSVYFELLNIEDKKLFYHHLKNAKWYINQKEINVIDGFDDAKDKYANEIKAIFGKTSNKTHSFVEQAHNLYKRHFISINEKSNVKKSKFTELEKVILDNNIDLEGDIRWIKIVFPKIVTNNNLKDVFCSFNCFPALNRELVETSYQLKEFINILPIKNENLFLDIESIVNTNGKTYKLQSKNETDQKKGTYVIRNENIGKLDHRNAKEYIIHLIELLKDESAAFSLFSSDFLHKKLGVLNQLISIIEKKVTETFDDTEETNYILIKPFSPKEKLLANYWTTNGKLANNIKSGSNLEVYKGIGIAQQNSHFITTSFGGKDELSMKERLDAYRRSLLSRDRIVTKEDIKALCLEFYADKIEKVVVKNAYTADIALKSGLVQCIEILLYPNPNVPTEAYEFESINYNLLLYLEKNSTSVFPFKIKVLS